MASRGLPEMPCGPILELHGQRKRFHIPFGLKPLIEDMTREVLRRQPENIYEFLAKFMETRCENGRKALEAKMKRKSWQQHRWSYEASSILQGGELQEFLESLNQPLVEAEHHAVVIQAAFRGYQARKKVKEIRKSIDKEKFEHEQEELRKSLVVEVKPEEHAEEEEIPKRNSRRPTLSITPENATEEENKSAVIIQSAFRGMQARKQVKAKRLSEMGEQPNADTPKRKSTLKDQPIAENPEGVPTEEEVKRRSTNEQPPTVPDGLPSEGDAGNTDVESRKKSKDARKSKKSDAAPAEPESVPAPEPAENKQDATEVNAES